MTNLWSTTFFGMGQAWPVKSDLCFGFLLRANGSAPTIDDLREHVQKRVHLVPALGDTFDVQLAEPPPAGTSPAQQMLGDAPWGLRLVPRPDENRWELYFFCHHGLLDAAGAVHALNVLLGDAEPSKDITRKPSRWQTVKASLAILPDVLTTYLPATPWAPLADAPGEQRAWAYAQVPTDALKAIAKIQGTTFNQVYLGAMGAALGKLGHVGAVHVVMPLDTRETNEQDVGNHLGLMRVKLDTSRSTVDISAKRTQRWKRFWHAVSAGGANRFGNWVHIRVAAPPRTAMAVSGLRVTAIAFQERQFDEVVPLPWLPPGGTCFTLLASYRGTTTMSVLTHGGTFDPRKLTELWEQEIRHQVTGMVRTP